MSGSSGEFSKAADFRIDELTLKSSSGSTFKDFQKIVFGLRFESTIFTNNMVGSLIVSDTSNLPLNMPLLGQDFLTVKLSTPTINQPIIDNVFCISEMTDREDISQGAQMYRLNLDSPETLLSNRVRIKNSFTDTPSSIVENIIRGKLKSTKELTIQKTTGVRKFVSPNLRPFDFIRNLTRESISSKGSPHYLFFESTRGYHFVSTDYMYSLPIRAKLIPSEPSLIKHGKRDLETEIDNIIEYRTTASPSTLFVTRGGMLSSILTVYNIFEKSYEVYDYDYFRDFDTHSRTGENPIYLESPIDDEENTISTFPDANINLHPTSKSGQSDKRYSGSFSDNQSETWLLKRRSKILEHSMGKSIQVMIHGRTDLAVGDMVHVTLPVTGKTHGKDEYDPFLSGKYLITHMEHIFSIADDNMSHSITMNLSQDGVDKFFEIVGNSVQPKKGDSVTNNVE